MKSKRLIFITLLTLTILLGLASRSSLFSEDSFVQRYVGDALWATAVFWSLRILSPHSHILKHAIWALIISFIIEASQLYHADWIDNLRSYRLGALVLGHTFVWIDLLCYTFGILFGAMICYIFIRPKEPTNI